MCGTYLALYSRASRIFHGKGCVKVSPSKLYKMYHLLCSGFLTFATFAYLLVLQPGTTTAYEVQTLLWDQGYTDDDFNHSPCMKVALAQLMCTEPPCNAVVLGVADGREVFELVEAGFSVVGVEPIPAYTNFIMKKAYSLDMLDKVKIWTAAAGAEYEEIAIRYGGFEVNATVLPVDSLVKTKVEVLSVDVHGDENNLDVLKGARQSLAKGLFDSVWVEIGPFPWTDAVLDLLTESGFVLFDVRWIGTSIRCERQGIPALECKERMSFAGTRPGTAGYQSFMIETKTASWQWLQSDIIAIHHTKLDQRLSEKLSNLRSFCPPRNQ